MKNLKRILTSTVVALATIAASGIAAAEDWPPAKMKVIITHGNGGTTGRLARAFGEIWQEHLKTKFIFENKSGASTRIGHDLFMNQPKDGSVLLAANISTAAIMYKQQKPSWVWEDSFVPLGLYSIDPGVIFVRKDSPYKTLGDVIAAAKKAPMTYSLSQWQSEDNLLIHQIMDVTGAKFEVIPHDVSTQALSQVIGGNIEVGALKVGPASSGGDAIRMLAIALPTNPIKKITGDIPTVAEAIGHKVMNVAAYRAFSVHKEFADKHPEHVKTLIETFKQTLADPRYIEAALKAGTSTELLESRTSKEIQEEIVEPVWANYEKFGDVFNQRK